MYHPHPPPSPPCPTPRNTSSISCAWEPHSLRGLGCSHHNQSCDTSNISFSQKFYATFGANEQREGPSCGSISLWKSFPPSADESQAALVPRNEFSWCFSSSSSSSDTKTGWLTNSREVRAGTDDLYDTWTSHTHYRWSIRTDRQPGSPAVQSDELPSGESQWNTSPPDRRGYRRGNEMRPQTGAVNHPCPSKDQHFLPVSPLLADYYPWQDRMRRGEIGLYCLRVCVCMWLYVKTFIF